MAEGAVLTKPDDSTLTAQQYACVRKEAERALRDAGALGILPTPVNNILEVARVEEVPEPVLSESFIAKMRTKAGASLKRALSKIRGLFHASAGLIFLDQTLHAVKKRFVRLHEAGHGFLPWQRTMYAVVEDCDKSLDPEAAELFDREANVFASEVLFQLDTFREMALAQPFSIWVPIRLSKKFNASIYSSIRNYVSKSDRCCAVIVTEMPEISPDDGFRATLRRAVQSPTFTERFGRYSWADSYTPDDEIGAMIPVGPRRSSGIREIILIDRNGDPHECVAEAFTQTYQVFILIHVVKSLTTPSIVVP